MRALVCGGREFTDDRLLAETLDALRRERGITLVIAGGARGADTLGEHWARSQAIACAVYMRWVNR